MAQGSASSPGRRGELRAVLDDVRAGRLRPGLVDGTRRERVRPRGRRRGHAARGADRARAFRLGRRPLRLDARRTPRAEPLAPGAARPGHEAGVGQRGPALRGRGRRARRAGRRRRPARRSAAAARSTFRCSCSRELADRTVVVALGYGRAGTDRFANDRAPSGSRREPTVGQGEHRRGERGPAPPCSPAGGARRVRGPEVSIDEDGASRGRRARPRPTARWTCPSELAPGTGAPRSRSARRRSWPSRRTPGPGNPSRSTAGTCGRRTIAYARVTAGRMVIDLVGLHRLLGLRRRLPGREQHRRSSARTRCAARREMHWIRIDRYYAGDRRRRGRRSCTSRCSASTARTRRARRSARCSRPSTAPRGSTSRSTTAASARATARTTVPYKVRRFNWFDYATRTTRSQNLVLNPDVTVRSRGVMEKCTLLRAAHPGGRRPRPSADGRAARRTATSQTACQQSCPAERDRLRRRERPDEPRVRAAQTSRGTTACSTSSNVKPSVGYLTKVRNREARKVERDETTP